MLKFSCVISTLTKSFDAKLLYIDDSLLIVTLIKMSVVKPGEQEELGEKHTWSPILPNALPFVQSVMKIK